MQKARTGVELVTSGELIVMDENDNEVPHDGETMGEIVVRGNVVMEGYYNDPEATAKAFAGGWFHTGDAAVVHPDGYAEIRDRIKDVIISGGENISSIEVEGVLLRHPAVQEVAIVGLPDEKWGESPHAFVVLKPGMTATEAELRAVHAGSARALQSAADRPLRRRTAEDRDRQNPEIRPARRSGSDLPAIAKKKLNRQDAKKRREERMVSSLLPSWRPCGRPLGSIGGSGFPLPSAYAATESSCSCSSAIAALPWKKRNIATAATA